MALPPVVLANIASAFVVVGLGAYVLRARRADLANVAFAAYATGFGAAVILHNIKAYYSLGRVVAPFGIEAALYVVIAVALVVLAVRIPRRATREDAGSALVAFAFAAVPIATGSSPWAVFVGATWGTVAFLALRFRSLEREEGRNGAALVAAALGLFLAFNAGVGALDLEGVGAVVMPGAPLATAALWLWTGARGGGRRAFLVAWALLGALLAGMLEAIASPGAPDLWGVGILRIASVALLGYAIIRHQVLGADVRARWAISRTTIAAAFVAVFFIASEAAQQFFGETLGSAYVGILAAGALVFAIAPLSRLADHVAELAVPRTTAMVTAADPEREEMYRSAVRLALRDRRLNRSEERDLFRLARGLGLESERAHDILAEMEGGGGEKRPG